MCVCVCLLSVQLIKSAQVRTIVENLWNLVGCLRDFRSSEMNIAIRLCWWRGLYLQHKQQQQLRIDLMLTVRQAYGIKGQKQTNSKWFNKNRMRKNTNKSNIYINVHTHTFEWNFITAFVSMKKKIIIAYINCRDKSLITFCRTALHNICCGFRCLFVFMCSLSVSLCISVYKKTTTTITSITKIDVKLNNNKNQLQLFQKSAVSNKSTIPCRLNNPFSFARMRVSLTWTVQVAQFGSNRRKCMEFGRARPMLKVLHDNDAGVTRRCPVPQAYGLANMCIWNNLLLFKLNGKWKREKNYFIVQIYRCIDGLYIANEWNAGEQTSKWANEHGIVCACVLCVCVFVCKREKERKRKIYSEFNVLFSIFFFFLLTMIHISLHHLHNIIINYYYYYIFIIIMITRRRHVVDRS